MRCKQVEKILVMGDEAGNTLREAAARHIGNCEACAQFQIRLTALRQEFMGRSADLPHHLESATRYAAHARLRSRWRRPLPYITVFNLPLPLAIVLVALTVLTLSCLLSGMGELSADEPMSLRTIISLSIIGQNLLMLMLSPVLLKNRKAFKAARLT